MNTDDLKKQVCEKIDENRDRILDVSRKMYGHPELGYKETFATDLVAGALGDLGLDVETGIAVTGCRATAQGSKDGPVVCIMGELDAVICREHADADKDTGAVHACGHNNQAGAMIGSAVGLLLSGAFDSLAGRVDFVGVPAEEYVEIEYRSKLMDEGAIRFFGGKQELIARGLLDDVDLCMMIHSLDMSKTGKKVLVGPQGNGFVGKRIVFTGQEAHAGAAPHEGINALNAAVLALNNIHAQRETFPDEDRIRVHPIITKGGDIVNIVPADVHMESYVRGRTTEGLLDANEKVNRAIRAGAMAVGAQVRINDIPGYLPLLNCPELDALFRANALSFVGEEGIQDGASFAGSFDIGDISHIMPILHPLIGGVTGGIHTRNFKPEDEELAVIVPAKCMAMTAVDLLAGGGKAARKIADGFQPKMTKKSYLEFMDRVSRVITA